MKKILLLIVLFSVVHGCATTIEPVDSEAFGRRWTLLVVVNNVQFFYDPQSVRTLPAGIVKFDGRRVNTYGYETLSRMEIDCRKLLIRSFDSTTYDKDHRPVGSTPDSGWTSLAPTSILYENKEVFCK